MVQTKNILSLIVLPTLALSSPSLHARHAHHHRAVKEHWVYETEIVATTTVTYGQVPAAEPTSAEVKEVKANINAVPDEPKSSVEKTSTTPPPAVPTLEEEDNTEPETIPEVVVPSTTSTSSAAKPSSTGSPSNSHPSGAGGQFAIVNNCNYDVTMTIDRTMCGPIERDIPITSGTTWYGDITSCDDANPAYKIYKLESGSKTKRDPSKPLQLEAGFKPSQNTLWYNISPKDCVDDMYGAGIQNCPGGPWYLSAKSTAANPGACQTFECSDAESCCTQSLGAYCDAWATAAKALGGLEPVGGCLGSLDQISLTAQLC